MPGTDGNEARNLGQTARLYIRPVINALPVDSAGAQGGPRLPAPRGPRRSSTGCTWSRSTGTRGTARCGSAWAPPAWARTPGARRRTRAEPRLPGDLPLLPDTRGSRRSPGPIRRTRPRRRRRHRPNAHAAVTGPGTCALLQRRSPHRRCFPPIQPGPPDPRKDLAERIAKEREWRQSTNKGVQFLALQYEATRCFQDDILAGNDDPELPLVTCDTQHKQAYLLAPSIISGDQIENASSGMDQHSGGYIVDVQFKSGAANTWADFTAAHIGTQTAFTLDSQVVSAPQIREAIPGGRTQITGGDPPFTASSAKELANVLKYGSLPLSFESSEAQTVSATLGLTSLRAGLIGGAIGLGLVLLYSLLYYRALGVLTALSLAASGAMVFAILVLLGRYINYTLDLAGIAGLIIGIGTTADSFVVFFERIKDEIREGKSFRSAIPRGWATGPQDDPVG